MARTLLLLSLLLAGCAHGPTDDVRALVREGRYREAQALGVEVLTLQYGEEAWNRMKGGRIPTAPTPPPQRVTDCRTPDNGGPQMRSLACY